MFKTCLNIKYNNYLRRWSDICQLVLRILSQAEGQQGLFQLGHMLQKKISYSHNTTNFSWQTFSSLNPIIFA
jgi:hypothetical protein